MGTPKRSRSTQSLPWHSTFEALCQTTSPSPLEEPELVQAFIGGKSSLLPLSAPPPSLRTLSATPVKGLLDSVSSSCGSPARLPTPDFDSFDGASPLL